MQSRMNFRAGSGLEAFKPSSLRPTVYATAPKVKLNIEVKFTKALLEDSHFVATKE